MQTKKRCLDFYGEKLKIGDEVVPINAENNFTNGYIFEIIYNKRKDSYYITIIDKDGNILEKKSLASKYTTKKRFIEREKEGYIYSLIFYNDCFWPESVLPLTNSTDYEYDIPEDACYAVLKANHLENKDKISPITNSKYTSHTLSTVYYFIVNKKIEVFHNEQHDFYYLYNPNTSNWYPIHDNYKTFASEADLKKYIKEIIKYFNKSDLTAINNDCEFDKNEIAQNFEKKLIHKIKY